MSRKLFNQTVAALCTAALLFAVAAGVEAQSDEPLFEEDIVCSIQNGPNLWIAPAVFKQELENAFGGVAIVEPLALLLQRIPAATAGSAVHFEGGYPGGSVALDLDQLGYTVEMQVVPQLHGAVTAVIRTA